MAWEVCPLVRGDSPKWFEGESSPRATVRVGHLPHCECGGGEGEGSGGAGEAESEPFLSLPDVDGPRHGRPVRLQEQERGEALAA